MAKDAHAHLESYRRCVSRLAELAPNRRRHHDIDLSRDMRPIYNSLKISSIGITRWPDRRQNSTGPLAAATHGARRHLRLCPRPMSTLVIRTKRPAVVVAVTTG